MSAEERLVLEVSTALKLCDMNRLTEAAPDTGTYLNLNRFLLQMVELLARTSDALTLVYFSHVPVSRQLPPRISGAGK